MFSRRSFDPDARFPNVPSIPTLVFPTFIAHHTPEEGALAATAAEPSTASHDDIDGVPPDSVFQSYKRVYYFNSKAASL